MDQAEPEGQDVSRHIKQCGAYQVWIPLCVYLLVAFMNFKAKLGISMQSILRIFANKSVLTALFTDSLQAA
jgi:hypothetical protein